MTSLQRLSPENKWALQSVIFRIVCCAVGPPAAPRSGWTPGTPLLLLTKAQHSPTLFNEQLIPGELNECGTLTTHWVSPYTSLTGC